MRGHTWPYKAEHAVDMVTGAVVEPDDRAAVDEPIERKAETKPLETY